MCALIITGSLLSDELDGIRFTYRSSEQICNLHAADGAGTLTRILNRCDLALKTLWQGNRSIVFPAAASIYYYIYTYVYTRCAREKRSQYVCGAVFLHHKNAPTYIFMLLAQKVDAEQRENLRKGPGSILILASFPHNERARPFF